ncbi:hypothetical protein MMC29_007591, partial [Sticta canariensis]|nr:hypothetical protein [Sticta canariensis]
MPSSGLARLASRTQPSCFLRSQLTPRRLPLLEGAPILGCVSGFSTSQKRLSDHGEETFDEFTARYERTMLELTLHPSQLINS